MNKYHRLKQDLDEVGTGKMKCFGGSMTPIFPADGVMMTYETRPEYEVGDVVFCKVRGRWIDAHIITRKSERGYLISNNHGHDNGWTNQVFGKVVLGEHQGRVIYSRS